jgi:RNA polymerase sigma-70 factor (ECF subfamily)
VDCADVTRDGVETSKEPVVSTLYERAKEVTFDDDLAMVDRFLAGDAQAFTVLYHRYYDRVFALAKGIVLDHEEAADLVQEIFTLVYRHLPRFDRRAKFGTWLFRIAVNRSIQEARKARFRMRRVELTEDIAPAPSEEVEFEDPKIHEAMGRMDPKDRALLALFYWDELSLQEIADSLGCSVNAAKTRLYRARERFRTLYEEAKEAKK